MALGPRPTLPNSSRKGWAEPPVGPIIAGDESAAMTEGASLLHDGFLLLGFSLAFVLVFRRLGLGATLGYLLAGAVVGPQVLGLVGDAESKLGIAELGITLLLFLVGLELNPSRLWRMKSDILGLGLIQVVACGLAVSAMIALATQFTLAAALAIGLPLALSSTAQVLPMLQSAGRLHTPFGERAFSILLFQDLSIIPLITIIAALSRNPAEPTARRAGSSRSGPVLAVAGLIAAGRFLVRPMFRADRQPGRARDVRRRALFIVMASAAALMQALGLSTALGAFVAGVMLADSPYRHELEADVEPFRSILLGLFFMSVGMMLDLARSPQRPVFVISMAAMA
jgi:monovalent cation:proton antiporter-2 (CPA2) family protein